MAEFLLHVVDDADTADIIDAKPDGYGWGDREYLDAPAVSLLVVRIPMTAMEAWSYLGPAYGGEHDTDIIHRSRYAVDISTISLDAVRAMAWVVPVLATANIIDKAAA